MSQGRAARWYTDIAYSVTPDANQRPSKGPLTRCFVGADDEIRTRDPHLGKVMLYQLSYVRVWEATLATAHLAQHTPRAVRRR